MDNERETLRQRLEEELAHVTFSGHERVLKQTHPPTVRARLSALWNKAGHSAEAAKCCRSSARNRNSAVLHPADYNKAAAISRAAGTAGTDRNRRQHLLERPLRAGGEAA